MSDESTAPVSSPSPDPDNQGSTTSDTPEYAPGGPSRSAHDESQDDGSSLDASSLDASASAGSKPDGAHSADPSISDGSREGRGASVSPSQAGTGPAASPASASSPGAAAGPGAGNHADVKSADVKSADVKGAPRQSGSGAATSAKGRASGGAPATNQDSAHGADAVAHGSKASGHAAETSPKVPPKRSTQQAEAPPLRDAGRLSVPDRVSSASDGSTPFTLDRVIRFLLGAAAVGAAGWLVWYFAGLVVYLVVGGILAYLLRPVVDRLQGLGLGRVPSILVTFALLFVVVSFAVTSIVPFVANQVRDISQLVSVEAATDVANYIESRVRSTFPIEEGVLVKNTRQIANALVNADLVEGDKVAETVSSVVSVFTNIVYAVIIIPFITFFLLKDGVQIRRSLLQLVPNRYFEIALAILDKVEGNIGRYFRALLVQCTSIAIIASTLLWLVGLENPIAIGLFTGLANTIPYFGPFLGFLGGSLVGIAQTGNFSLIPGVALAMGLTQLSDNVLLQPIIFSRAAKAHPLVILFVVLVGAQLGGIVGMLIAIPLATTFRVVGDQILWSLRNYRILRNG